MEPSAQHGAKTTNALTVEQQVEGLLFNIDEFSTNSINTDNRYATDTVQHMTTSNSTIATISSHLTQDYLLSQTNCADLLIMDATESAATMDSEYERQILADLAELIANEDIAGE